MHQELLRVFSRNLLPKSIKMLLNKFFRNAFDGIKILPWLLQNFVTILNFIAILLDTYRSNESFCPGLDINIFFIYFRLGRKKTVISTLAMAGVFCSIVGGISSVEKKSQSIRSRSL